MRKREKNREIRRAAGFTGVGVCTHRGEIRAAGSVRVFGKGGKDK